MPGGASPDSATWSFATVPPPPPVVTLMSPVNSATHQSLTPTLAWSAAEGSTAYDVYAGIAPSPPLLASNVTGTTYAITSKLSPGTPYFWKIVAKNAGGSAPDSPIWSFSTGTPPGPATLASPSNGAVDQPLSPTLVWTAAPGATAYDVYVGTTNPPAILASNVTATSYAPNGLTNGATYFWKIVAFNGDGPSPDSPLWSFATVPAPPPAVSLAVPTNTATGQSPTPTLTWVPAARATTYDVYLGTSNPPALVATGVTGTNYLPSTALPTGTVHYWKISAKNAGGTSPDSAVWSFTTAAPPPAVSLTGPTNGATNQPLSPTLSWAASTGATAYDVYLGTSNPPALIANNIAGDHLCSEPRLDECNRVLLESRCKERGRFIPRFRSLVLYDRGPASNGYSGEPRQRNRGTARSGYHADVGGSKRRNFI